MRNYRRALRERVTEPGLSGLLKLCTSSATRVEKKYTVGLEEESLPLYSFWCFSLVPLSSCIGREKQ